MSYLTIDWIQYWENMICWQHRITAYICLHAFLNYDQIQSYRWTSDKLGTLYATVMSKRVKTTEDTIQVAPMHVEKKHCKKTDIKRRKNERI